MSKLRIFLWVVVFGYLLYAINKEGMSALLGGLLILACATVLMRLWLHSDKRRKLRDKYGMDDDEKENNE